MRPTILILCTVFAFQGSAFAQVGFNSISICTTSEGNISWNANVDGHHRKGYLDRDLSAEMCNRSTLDKDVLVPVNSDLYPNPSTDMLFFTGTGYDSFMVTIKDMDGEIMATEKYFDRTSMDISSFKDGIYTIEIVAERTGETRTKKLVKE